MKYRINHIFRLALLSLVSLNFIGCNNDFEELYEGIPQGKEAYFEATIEGNTVTAKTRSYGADDGWTVTSFTSGDKVGMYSLTGRQNPENELDFSLPMNNVPMNYLGNVVSSSSVFRFGNSEVTLDPTTVASKSALMYYPYYENMPETTDKTVQPGLPLKKVDPNDGIEKYIDFMYVTSMNITNGVMSPEFRHYSSYITLMRGEGFREAKDKRVWFVLTNPVTDIRITQTSATSGFSYTLQNNPTESEEDLMIEIPGISKIPINKNCLWQCWDGKDYNNNPAQYVLLPPTNTAKYIIIQDDYGTWQHITDFYTDTPGRKYTYSGERYLMTISLKGLDVTVRTVTAEKWDDEIEITDDRAVGINNDQEYYNWVTLYNAYIDANRDASMINQLRAYGDAKTNTATGETEWTFYINNDIKFRGSSTFAKVTRLEDKIEGSSTYKNYVISKPLGTMFGEMGPKGCISSLDFNEIYLIQPDTDNQPYSPLIGIMSGGLIENCNINNAIVVSHEEVGMVAGTVMGGTISNCSFSGDAIGKNSGTLDGIQGLFGEIKGAPTLTKVSTKGLKFILN